MSVLEFRLATVACLIICLSGKISANFWRHDSFPSDPNDKYYEGNYQFVNVFFPVILSKLWIRIPIMYFEKVKRLF